MSKPTCSFDECDIPSRARGWCWPHYKQWYRGEDMRPVGSLKPPEERFWRYVQKTGTCWNWTGSNSKGYGLFKIGKQTIAAHRFSFALANGEIPEGKHLDHICHNHSCVNPEHLRPVTQKQNAEHRKGAQTNSKTGVRGVHWDNTTGRYAAVVNHYGKRYRCGFFGTLEEAAQAVLAKRNELFTHNDADRRVA
jgi:hypothetical protein